MLFYLLFFVLIIAVCSINDLLIEKRIFKTILLGLVCLALVFFLALKGKNVGSDTADYMDIYDKALNGLKLGHVSSDYGYALICKLFAQMKLPYLAFSFFVAFLEVFGIFVLCFVFSKHSAIFFSSFFAISQLQMLISAQRQSIACSFVFLAVSILYILRTKKIYIRLIPYYLVCLLAFSFHKASAIAFIFPALFLIKFNLKHLFLFGFSIVFLCIFSSQISELFTYLHLTNYANFNVGTFQTYSIFGLLLSMVIFFIYSSKPILSSANSEISFGVVKNNFKQLFNLDYYLSHEITDFKTQDYCVNYSSRFVSLGFVGAIFMSFSSFSGTLTRFAFFCFPFLYLSLSNSLVLFNRKEKLILYFLFVFLFFVLFVWLFIYKDPLNCVPYYVEF